MVRAYSSYDMSNLMILNNFRTDNEQRKATAAPAKTETEAAHSYLLLRFRGGGNFLHKHTVPAMLANF